MGNPQSEEVLLTDTVYPRLLVTFGGADAFRPQMEIDAEQFIGIKGYDARGKRLATWEVAKIEELEPLRFPDPTDDSSDDNGEDEEENLDPDADKSEQQIRDELTGQTSLDFGDE